MSDGAAQRSYVVVWDQYRRMTTVLPSMRFPFFCTIFGMSVHGGTGTGLPLGLHDGYMLHESEHQAHKECEVDRLVLYYTSLIADPFDGSAITSWGFLPSCISEVV